MKKIRIISTNRYFLFALLASFFTYSSSYALDTKKCIQMVSEKTGYEFSGEELFKSIVFADGKLTSELPALNSISNISSMKPDELKKYRDMEQESVNYLKKSDANYFSKFQANLYSKDPETISKAINKIVTDLIPFINGKLALQNLSIEKLEGAVQKDSKGNIDFNKTQSQMKQMCVVWVVGLLVVAVALVWVVAISAVAVVGNQIVGSGSNISLEAISIQTAERL